MERTEQCLHQIQMAKSESNGISEINVLQKLSQWYLHLGA